MRRTLALCLAAAALAGCGGGKPREQAPLRFEQLEGGASLDDTTGLNRGRPLLASLEPYRMANRALRVKGEMDLPNGTRMQLSIYRTPDRELVSRVQVVLEDRRFDSPPIIGPHGPLAEGDYRIEALVHFNDTWQPHEVMLATGNGRKLRGPGFTRTRQGDAAFMLTQERHL